MQTKTEYNIEGTQLVKRTWDLDETKPRAYVEGNFYRFNKTLINEEKIYLDQIKFK